MTKKQAAQEPDRIELVVVCIPGREDNDPATFYVMDRRTRRQVAGGFATSQEANAALQAARSF
jgi:hypothetical protein